MLGVLVILLIIFFVWLLLDEGGGDGDRQPVDEDQWEVMV